MIVNSILVSLKVWLKFVSIVESMLPFAVAANRQDRPKEKREKKNCARILYTLALRMCPTFHTKSTAESAATEPQMVPSTVLGPLYTVHRM